VEVGEDGGVSYYIHYARNSLTGLWWYLVECVLGVRGPVPLAAGDVAQGLMQRTTAGQGRVQRHRPLHHHNHIREKGG
jgi:hypothetical protein